MTRGDPRAVDPLAPHETPRLRITPLGDADAPFLRRLVNEPLWREHIGRTRVGDDVEARAYLHRIGPAFHGTPGLGYRKVSRRDDDVPLGIVGFITRDSLPGPDLGFAFLAEAHGHGYAEEASRAVMAREGRLLGVAEFLAISSEANAPAARLLEKLGFARGERRDAPAGGPALVVWSCRCDASRASGGADAR